jgi:KaiC/GvpD/RAD55 family RecA-like ATPase
MTPPTLLEAALQYALRGWHVCPLLPRGKEPDGRLVRNGHHSATRDEETIRSWWSRSPDANVAISLEPSGLVVLDVDVKDERWTESLSALEGELPSTLQVDTGSGGMHDFYLRGDAPAARKIRFRPGLDLLGKGYVVAAPSIHPNGEPYVWRDERAPIAPLPAVLARVLVPSRAERESEQRDDDFGPASPEVLDRAWQALLELGPSRRGDGGDQKAFRMGAILLHDFALRDEEAWMLAKRWNDHFPENEWTDAKLEQKLRNSRYAQGERGIERGIEFKPFGRGASEQPPSKGKEKPERAPVAERLSEIARRPREPVRSTRTGWPKLDDLIGGGLTTRQLMTVCGPPGAGKSGWAVSLALNVEPELPVLYVSTELETQELLARFASPLLEKPWRDIVRQPFGSSMPQVVGDRRIYIIGSEHLPRDARKTLELIVAESMTIEKAHGVPPAIIVDYLQDMARSSEKDQRQIIGDLASHLRAIAQQGDCPVVAVSSVSRQYYGIQKAQMMRDADDATVYLAAAKESGDVDFAAAVVLFLDVDKKTGLARIAVAKSRHGETGFVGMKFEGSFGSWSSDDSALEELSPEKIAERAEDDKRVRFESRILSFLEQAGAGACLTKQQIEAGVSGRGTEKREAIARLVGKKQIVELAGRFSLPKEKK